MKKIMIFLIFVPFMVIAKYGKIQVVNSLSNYKVQLVESFADTAWEWQFIDSFPDYKIKYLGSFSGVN